MASPRPSWPPRPGQFLKIPLDLEEVYSWILSSIDGDYVNDAKLILQWVVVARRPLTAGELARARVLGPEAWGKDTIPPADILEELIDNVKCWEPLLHLAEANETIDLVHQSTKEYRLGLS